MLFAYPALLVEGLPTVGDAIDTFLSEREWQGKSVATYRSLLQWLQVDRDCPITSVDASTARSALYAYARGHKPASTLTFWGVLRSFGSWCLEQGYLPKHPLEGIKPPKVPEQPHRYLSEDQIAHILKAAWKSRKGAELALIVTLLFETGLRRGELVRIQWGDIDWSKKRLSVPQHKTSPPRLVPLSDHVLSMLRYRRHTDKRIFPVRPDAITERIHRLGQRAGLPLFVHLYRHSWATDQVKRKKPLWAIQQVGGWKDEKMLTTRYARSVIQEEAVEALRE